MIKIEVGKRYKGKINGVIFEVVSYNPKNEYFEIITDDKKTFYHAKSFLEHLLVEELR